MRVLVDTSVWVDFFNEHPGREAELLRRMIEDEVQIATCGVVIAEFFQGIRREETRPALEQHFRSMVQLVPQEPNTYFAAADLFRALRAQGITIRSTIDCLIARLAEENDVLLLAKDRDVTNIVASGLCKVKALPIP